MNLFEQPEVLTDGFDFEPELSSDRIFGIDTDASADEEEAALSALPEGDEEIFDLDAADIAQYTALFQSRMRAAFSKPDKIQFVRRALREGGITMNGLYPLETRAAEFSAQDDEVDYEVDGNDPKWAEDRAYADEYRDDIEVGEGVERRRMAVYRESQRIHDANFTRQYRRTEGATYDDGSGRAHRRHVRAVKQEAKAK